jgi:hypothetical protein
MQNQGRKRPEVIVEPPMITIAHKSQVEMGKTSASAGVGAKRH